MEKYVPDYWESIEEDAVPRWVRKCVYRKRKRFARSSRELHYEIWVWLHSLLMGEPPEKTVYLKGRRYRYKIVFSWGVDSSGSHSYRETFGDRDVIWTRIYRTRRGNA